MSYWSEHLILMCEMGSTAFWAYRWEHGDPEGLPKVTRQGDQGQGLSPALSGSPYSTLFSPNDLRVHVENWRKWPKDELKFDLRKYILALKIDKD